MILIPWIVFAIVWIIGTRFGKPTTRRETVPERALHVMGSGIGAFLIFGFHEVAKSNIRETVGFVLTVLGIALAIWARVILGANWSGMVTLKEGHELIRRGPYAFVRHPIYSGILLALLGTAISIDGWQSFLGVAILFVTWVFKSRIEERFMVEHFGDEYRRYRRQVRALIPGLL